MNTLTTIIPDVDVLLALAPEELAETLLSLAYEHRQQSGMIHPQTTLQHIDGVSDGTGGYPMNKKSDAAQAISEAWNWLSVNGLLIADAGINGNSGYMRFSRRALNLLSNSGFQSYARSIAFPKSLLHPTISDEVWIDLARGDLPTAVFKAFKAVEVAVREAGNFDSKDIGVPLMRKAFDKTNGPLTDLSQPEGERDALASLFVGAIGSYKNPHSHRTVTITDSTEAQEMVVFASHLLRIVDSRR